MLTRDGVEITANSCFYFANGETVIVNEMFTNSNDVDMVGITPVLEGSAMDCKLYPEGSTEIHVDYKHEGVEQVVRANTLYAKPPTVRIEEGYAKKQEELKAICQKIGLARVEQSAIRKENKTETDLMIA